MTWSEAILLAVVQGLTEFLPVSSSGHLGLLQWWFAPLRETNLSLSILLHLGTLAALLIYFRRDLYRMAVALLGRPAAAVDPHDPLAGRETAYVGLLVAAMVPTALIGVLLKRASMDALTHPAWIGLFLLVTAALLAAPRWLRRNDRARRRPVTLWQALLVGAVQGFAVLPGISRSGSTIVAGILAGMEDSDAARFSFHLSIPAILGAAVFEGIGAGSWRAWIGAAEIAGFAIAAATGLVAIDCLLRVVRRRRLGLFSYYCTAVGVAVLLLSVLSESW
jgi:undecaprenyl-diphosphatase